MRFILAAWLIALPLVALSQTRQVTLDSSQARFSPTALEVAPDGGCLVTQCYDVEGVAATGSDCVKFDVRQLARRNACLTIIDLGRRRALSRVFAVDGGE